jgi:hypothetical protein
MNLSDKAKNELREVLKKDIGLERANAFSDEELNEIGLFLLTAVVVNLKLRVARPELFVYCAEFTFWYPVYMLYR